MNRDLTGGAGIEVGAGPLWGVVQGPAAWIDLEAVRLAVCYTSEAPTDSALARRSASFLAASFSFHEPQ